MKGRGSGGRARPQAQGGWADGLVSRAVNTRATVDPCPDSPSHPSPTRPGEQPWEFRVVGLRSIVISFLRVGQLPGRRPWQALGVSRAGRDGQEVASPEPGPPGLRRPDGRDLPPPVLPAPHLEGAEPPSLGATQSSLQLRPWVWGVPAPARSRAGIPAHAVATRAPRSPARGLRPGAAAPSPLPEPEKRGGGNQEAGVSPARPVASQAPMPSGVTTLAAWRPLEAGPPSWVQDSVTLLRRFHWEALRKLG